MYRKNKVNYLKLYSIYGISLIMLVITIIVMIILATTVIITIVQNNPIEKTKEAKFKSDIKNVQEELEMYVDKLYLDTLGNFDRTTVRKENLELLKDSRLSDKIDIQNGQLVYIGKDEKEKIWFDELIGIKSSYLDGFIGDISFGNNGNTDGVKVNSPVLKGMIPVKYNGNTESNTTINDKDWYKYVAQSGNTDNASSYWANAKSKDGSYWVWIPRYAYKIETPHTSIPCQIDVKFLEGTTNKYDNNGTISNLPEGYIVHPAFKFGDKDLTGIWVAKYEASNNNGNIKVVPNVSSWQNINVANMFNNCYIMATNPVYGFDNLINGDTHMMKNIEWGAVAYIAHSKYGRNGNEITINNSSSCITGSAGNTVSAASDVGTTAYNTVGGYLASTTGNISGIYDMSGGAYEYVAGYLSGTTLIYAGNSINFDNQKINEKFFDLYSGYNDLIKGDATYETSSHLNDFSSWFDDSSYVIDPQSFFIRGGNCYDRKVAGMFFFDSNDGDIKERIRF